MDFRRHVPYLDHCFRHEKKLVSSHFHVKYNSPVLCCIRSLGRAFAMPSRNFSWLPRRKSAACPADPSAFPDMIKLWDPLSVSAADSAPKIQFSKHAASSADSVCRSGVHGARSDSDGLRCLTGQRDRSPAFAVPFTLALQRGLPRVRQWGSALRYLLILIAGRQSTEPGAAATGCVARPGNATAMRPCPVAAVQLYERLCLRGRMASWRAGDKSYAKGFSGSGNRKR